MSWKDDFKKGFDLIYRLVHKKVMNLKFPCYGGRFFGPLLTRRFECLYFYLTPKSIIYTTGGYITEIPFDKIKKLSIKQGLIVKSSFHIRIVADKKYHLLIKDMKWLSTKLTGDNADNVRNFIDTLRSSVKNK